MNARSLETYSFWWSELRLLVAATALFLGGIPPIYLLVPTSFYSVTMLALKLAWVISGVAAIHLLYRWYDRGQRLFGRRDHKDTLAFLVLIVSGINLGFAGIFGLNLGMTVTTSHFIFFLVGIAYLFAAYQLWMSFKKNRNKVF